LTISPPRKPWGKSLQALAVGALHHQG